MNFNKIYEATNIRSNCKDDPRVKYFYKIKAKVEKIKKLLIKKGFNSYKRISSIQNYRFKYDGDPKGFFIDFPNINKFWKDIEPIDSILMWIGSDSYDDVIEILKTIEELNLNLIPDQYVVWLKFDVEKGHI
jgi:hypothetical protein